MTTAATPATTGPTTYELSGVMTALSSILHSSPGQTFGTVTMFRREKICLPDDRVEEIPIVSGNSLRGRLRDLGMAYCCRVLGYGQARTNEAGEVQRIEGLTMPAFYLLFSGGSLTSGEGAKALDLRYVQRLQSLIPLLGVFGGAVGNHGQHGKLIVDKAYPICAETAHLLPDAYRGTESVWGLLQRETYTRTDDAKNTIYHPLLSGETQQKLLAGVRAKDLADAGPQQMLYEVETLCAGTRFYWRVLLKDVTEVEFEAFLSALIQFSKQPYIGGRSAVGHGHVAFACDQWRRIDHRLAPEGAAIDVPIGARYHQHLAQHRDEIRELLASMTT
jgi:RAMP superfamily